MIDIEKERAEFDQWYGLEYELSDSTALESAAAWAAWQARAEHQSAIDAALIEKLDAAMEDK